MRERLATAIERDYRYLVLAASMLIFTVGSGGLFILVVNLKPIAAEFLWPRTVPSLAYSLQFFGAGVGGIAMGWWVDRSGIGWPALLGAVMIGSGAIRQSICNWFSVIAVPSGATAPSKPAPCRAITSI